MSLRFSLFIACFICSKSWENFTHLVLGQWGIPRWGRLDLVVNCITFTIHFYLVNCWTVYALIVCSHTGTSKSRRNNNSRWCNPRKSTDSYCWLLRYFLPTISQHIHAVVSWMVPSFSELIEKMTDILDLTRFHTFSPGTGWECIERRNYQGKFKYVWYGNNIKLIFLTVIEFFLRVLEIPRVFKGISMTLKRI